MLNCLFCKIGRKEVPSEVIYEDSRFLAFKDINPQAPVHLLVIPKKHIHSVDHLELKDKELMGEMLIVAQKIAREKGLSSRGYRLVLNVGEDAGQSVDHLHLHIIGGKTLPWP